MFTTGFEKIAGGLGAPGPIAPKAPMAPMAPKPVVPSVGGGSDAGGAIARMRSQAGQLRSRGMSQGTFVGGQLAQGR